MKLTDRYRLLVTGDIRKLQSSTAAIGYLFGRLLNGQRAEMWNLENLGIHVRQLEDNCEIITVPPEVADIPLD